MRVARGGRAITMTVIACLAVTLGISTTIGVATSEAQASVGPNPRAQVDITKLYDGTGHGTSAASFVNSANGYSPADDTPTDGVVSVGDTVGYNVNLRIDAGPARTVSVRINPDSRLTWTSGADSFCTPAPGINAVRSGAACLFTVKQGATAQLSRNVVLTANVTSNTGVATPDQNVSVVVGLQNQTSYATVESDPVTVVSAPKVDFALTSPLVRMVSDPSQTGGTGSFTVVPERLEMLNYSSTKGYATAMPWVVDVDVSSFPDTFTWSQNGQPNLPVVDGKISVRGTGFNEVIVTYNLGANPWPIVEDNTSRFYQLQLVVPDTTLQTANYRNNGDGWQPGDGLTRDQSTADPIQGSAAGMLYANNDFGAVRIARDVPSVGRIFTKAVFVPYAPSETLFESGNMVFNADSSNILVSNQYVTATRSVGSQFRADLAIRSEAIGAGSPSGSSVIGDVWDANQAQPRGPVRVVNSVSGVIDPSQYRVQWSALAPSASAITDANVNTGWVNSLNPIPHANAVRVVFNPGTINPNTGDYVVQVDMVSRADYPTSGDPMVRDTMHGLIGSSTGSVPGVFSVTWPDTPVLELSNPGDTGTVNPGESVSYSYTPRVNDPVSLQGGFVPNVSVTLDRCTTDPIPVHGSEWIASVVAATAGPTGRVCGDPDSTPATITFTPSADVIAHVDWDGSVATLPTVGYTATTTFSASGSVATSADFSLTDVPDALEVSASGFTNISAYTVSAASVTALDSRVEINRQMSWDTMLVQRAEQGVASVVVVLPRNNDDSLWTFDEAAAAGYEGARSSSFTGTYRVDSVTVDAENTSPSSNLFFTTTPNPSFDASTSEWHRLDQAGIGGVPALAGATALRMTSESTDSNPTISTSKLSIAVTPSGNRNGDDYLMWVGPTTVTGASVGASQPWPAPVEAVMSSISGSIRWDNDASGGFEPGDAPIQGVRVGLFAIVDGVVASSPQTTVLTNASGGYAFNNLYAGEYVTRITDRGANLPDGVMNYYGVNQDVDTTYSFSALQFERSSETSTPIALGMATSQSDVDFGFYQGDAKVDVDKTNSRRFCSMGVCEVEWSVDIENLGNSDVRNGTFVDSTSNSVYDVEVFLAESVPETTFTETYARLDGGYALSDTGKVYSWGNGAFGANGDGSVANNPAPNLVSGLNGVTIAKVYPRTNGAYAVDIAGGLYSWGDGVNGSNGNNLTTDALTAVRVQGLPVGSRVADVFVERSHVLVKLTNNGIYVGGSKFSSGAGSAANGNIFNPLYGFTAGPIRSINGVTTSSELDPFVSRTMQYVTKQNGETLMWGRVGLLANNVNGESVDPVLVAGVGSPTASIFEDIGTRSYFLIKDDGSVATWGRNNQYLMGNNSNTRVSSPIRLNIPAVRANGIYADSLGVIAHTVDGRIYTWGGISTPSINGAGETLLHRVPTALAQFNTTRADQFLANGGGFNVLTTSGDVYSWGRSTTGQNATGNANAAAVYVPTLASGLPRGQANTLYALEQSGSGAIYAKLDSGDIYAWGPGLLGTNPLGSNTANQHTARRIALPSGTVVEDVIQSEVSSGQAVLFKTNTDRYFRYGTNPLYTKGTANIGTGSPVELTQLAGRDVTSFAVGVGFPTTANTASSNTSPVTMLVGTADFDYYMLGDYPTTRPYANQATIARVNSLTLINGGVGGVSSASHNGVNNVYFVGDNGFIYSWGSGVNAALGNGFDIDPSTVVGTHSGTTPSTTIINDANPLFVNRTASRMFAVTDGGQQNVVPTTPAQLIRSSAAGAYTQREYAIPNVKTGESVPVIIRGKINQRTGVTQVVANQAWFTSPTTPITGLLPAGQIRPTLPVVPAFNNVNPIGIPGNATCNTDASPGGQAIADSCDQVPLALPAALPGSLGAPGSVSGMFWLDRNRDGIKQSTETFMPNVPVTLFRDGQIMGSATTNASGAYVFETVPSGIGYTVSFALQGMTPTTAQLGEFGITAGSFAPTQANGRGATTSWMNPTTLTSGAFEVLADVREENINGGAVLNSVALSVVKSSSGQSSVSLPVNAEGMTPVTQIDMTFTNTGTDTLSGFSLNDQTLSGIAMTGLSCGSFNVSRLLLPNESVSCTGTLPSFALGDDDHMNRFTVSATGVSTQQLVSASDDFEAVAEGDFSWTMSKSSNPVSDTFVTPGSTIEYTLVVTNTGDLTLRDAEVFDDLADVVSHGELVTPVSEGLQVSGDGLVWTVPEVAPGMSAEVKYSVVVNEDAYGVTLVNSAHGTGVVPPTACTVDAPCITEHHTSPWPGALPLPVLGNVAFLTLMLGGLVLIAGGVSYSVISRRKRAVVTGSDQG